MLYLQNFGRRLKTKEDEIVAIKRLVGTNTQDGEKFEVIELKHSRNGRHPVKIRGFQDTDVRMDERGEARISNREAGIGSLSFEPDSYNNRLAFLAKTEHNIKMLMHSWREKKYVILSADVRSEVQKRAEEWWLELDKTEEGQKTKKTILRQEEEARLTPQDMPSKYSDTIVDAHAETLVDEIAALREKLAKAEAINTVLTGSKEGVVDEPKSEPEPKQEVESEPNGDGSDDISSLDLDGMSFSRLQGLARRYGVEAKGVQKPELIASIRKAAAEEKVT